MLIMPELTPLTTTMRQSGSLNAFEQRITNPAIGVEFPNIDLVAVMDDPNSDEILRDIAILSKLIFLASL